MSAVLICGLVFGGGALLATYRSIPRWPRFISVALTILFCVIGMTPAFLLHRNLLEGTKLVAAMSATYFLIFSVIGVVALSGRLSRTQNTSRV
jgi:hypothetical protein